MTEYREIARFPGYRVGDDGSVWSRVRRGQSAPGKVFPWRKMKGNRADGYLVYCLRGPDGSERIRGHRLVLEAFVGLCPPGMEGCHWDGVRDNNRLSNLRWATRLDNTRDMDRHNTKSLGAKHHATKLDPEKVREIRRLRADGLSHWVIANRFSVHSGTVQALLEGKTWRHVQ